MSSLNRIATAIVVSAGLAGVAAAQYRNPRPSAPVYRSSAPVYRPSAPVYRPSAPVYRPEPSRPVYHPNEPISRPEPSRPVGHGPSEPGYRPHPIGGGRAPSENHYAPIRGGGGTGSNPYGGGGSHNGGRGSSNGGGSHNGGGGSHNGGPGSGNGGGGGTVTHYPGNSGNMRGGYSPRSGGPSLRGRGYVEAPVGVVVVSPWYFYNTLPGYLSDDAVQVVDGTDCDWTGGDDFTYDPNGFGANKDLDDAINDIVAAFKQQDQSAIDALIGSGGQVGIYNDEQYMYSVGDSDFDQMLADCALGSATISFDVTSVKVEGDHAIVKCVHKFTDADGSTQAVYQQYKLTDTGAQYQVTDFSTSDTPL